MKRYLVAVLVLCALVIPGLAAAASLRVQVADFAVSPADQNHLKSTLPKLLSSRLASDQLLPVGAGETADLVVNASYTQLGRIFSLDAVARTASGRVLSSVFEQGEGQDDLIPALTRLAAKLRSEVAQRYQKSAEAAPAPTAPAAPAGAASAASASAFVLPAAQAAKGAAAPGAVQAPTTPAPSNPDFIVPEQVPVSKSGWISARIPFASIGLAPAAAGAGSREFFVAEDHTLRLYRADQPLKLLAEMKLPMRTKLISVDAIAPDQDGNPRVVLTIMDGDNPASQIVAFRGGKLVAVAKDLPYLFRSLIGSGGKAKLYAQAMGRSDDYLGPLYEVMENNGKVELKNPVKLPRFATIFNYNSFTGADGKVYGLAFSPDGYLLVYDDKGEELWRSADKFSGSETYFHREVGANPMITSEKVRWLFLDQRITVTPAGEIIVPQNAGMLTVGNNRSYSKNSLFCFTWNGSTMEERWRTRQSPSYLADYYFDPAAKELVLLEVVQKEGVLSKGGSMLRVLRPE